MDKVYLVLKCVFYDKTNRQILLFKRSDYKPKTAGLWDALGGSVEHGEESEKAVLREISEESNIIPKSVTPFSFYSRMMDDGEHYLIFGLYVCDDYEIPEEGIILSHEHVECRWVPVEELESYDIIPSVGNLREELMGRL